jgi:hypothetical protein
MHKAANQLPASLHPRIKSVVMFGDPNLRLGRLGDPFPTALRSKVLQNCALEDPVRLNSLFACRCTSTCLGSKALANSFDYRSVIKERVRFITWNTSVLSGPTEL